jgi:hypothetical protein
VYYIYVIHEVKFVKNNALTTKNKENEIYVSRKRKNKNIVKFYYERAYSLLNELNYKEIYVCGLGACLNDAIKIALFIVDALNGVEISNIETKTITHIDDFRNEENNVFDKYLNIL